MKNIYCMAIVLVLALGACHTEKPQKAAEQVYYTCSMDPQIVEPNPGTCPICKMALTKVVIDTNVMSKGLKISDAQKELAHIQTTKIQFEEIGREMALIGQLAVNENKRNTLSSPVSGRIEHLYVKNIGTAVAKGGLLYEIYSEELLKAQEEYLLAKNQSLATQKQLQEAAAHKLMLWGMSEPQIKALSEHGTALGTVKIYSKTAGVVSSINISEGTYVMEGMLLFEIVDLGTLWVEAQYYAHEMTELPQNKSVRIKVDGYPDREWKAKVNFVVPQLEARSKSNLIRAEINNHDQVLKPGMQASIWLQHDRKRALAVPINAVIQDSQGAKVWILKGDTYESRQVHLGIESGDKIEIVSGLSIGDEVVTSGAYLLNSEYVFRKGMKP